MKGAGLLSGWALCSYALPMLPGHQRVAASVALVMASAMLGACGSSSGSPAPTDGQRSSSFPTAASTAVRSTAQVNEPAAGAGWFSEPPVTDVPGEADDPDLGPDTPHPMNGAQVAVVPPPTPPKAGAGSPADGNVLPAYDPCSLLSPTEWQSWTGSTQASAVRAGDECLFAEPKDHNRMSLAIYPGFPHYLDADQKSTAERVTGLDVPAYWLPGKPTAYGATMVAEADGHDVVIELFTRVPAHDAADLKNTAQRWLDQAIGGLR